LYKDKPYDSKLGPIWKIKECFTFYISKWNYNFSSHYWYYYTN